MGAEAWFAVVRRAEEAPAARREFARYLRANADASADVDAAELIFSELLSNALRFGEARMSLAWLTNSALLRVHDGGQPFNVPPLEPPDLGARSGRGLFLVRKLAKQLTYERDGDGNVAKAVLPVRLRGTAR